MELRLLVQPGQTVVVTNASGAQITGKLMDLSAASISVGRRALAEAQVRRVDRLGDPLWNGAIIGLGIGVGAGLASVAVSDCRDFICALIAGPSLLLGGALGMVTGLVIDAFHKERGAVYIAPNQAEWARPRGPHALSIAPVLGANRQRVLVTIRF